ncbi:MAG: restriction endonuclease [Deltaproteobacteria bacterium]|nr:restriction endonuclease [Deltaproteobacteria bacterium]
MTNLKNSIPKYLELAKPVLKALITLGASAHKREIVMQVAKDMDITERAQELCTLKTPNIPILEMRISTCLIYFKCAGLIGQESRGGPFYIIDMGIDPETINYQELPINYRKWLKDKKDSADDAANVDLVMDRQNFERSEINSLESVLNENKEEEEDILSLGEYADWREELRGVLAKMNPFAFERLTKRLLLASGFVEVEVTKKSGDGGIDGHGKLQINGIFSFTVAFQCKRYTCANPVSASDIRDFRGSMTTNVEKGVFITTGRFSNSAVTEASLPGKKQIDLIDGDGFIDKLAQYRMGLVPVESFEVKREYFEKI